MNEDTVSLGGLRTVVAGSAEDAALHLVMLHGFGMKPGDLSPFAHAMGGKALTFLPEGPLRVESRGHAWWSSLSDRRLPREPRDLAGEYPAGRTAAREILARFVSALKDYAEERPLVLAGFSQGGMLACDAVLLGGVSVAGLALMSSSRIAVDEWATGRDRLRGLPVFVSHGRQDDDLAFAAGEGLRDFAIDAGARVTWLSFDQGHELPLVVWRQLKKFLFEVVALQQVR